MLTGVRSVNLAVADQDRAKQFWTEVAGFELLGDTPMGDEGGARWIEVTPPDRSVILVLLAARDQGIEVGTWSNVIFHCDDINKTFEELRDRGVEFPDEPRREFWGWWATFKDSEGNTYGLGQRGE